MTMDKKRSKAKDSSGGEVMEGEEGDLDKAEMSSLIAAQNKKKKKSGGFQSMGLANEVFRGIMKKGYKVPTPIQRKGIPPLLEGRDVVAMARTGSGKTAAFLVPLFQKLMKTPAPGQKAKGARAIVFSPTRELALQTLKFTRELGRYTGLRAACVLGGESMEKQFAVMHERPDAVIATPGRFVHLCVEMGLRLDSVEYVVFDEADRLFEMGFGEQLREILGRLPDNRQTALFSATLPKLLVEFAKAGLSDPTLIRLDVDTKIPETLRMAFFHCREEGKIPALLHLLKDVMPAGQQAVVFCATRHHVEYLHLVLDAAGVSNTFIYSHLDSAARKINAAKFAARKSTVLLVTDLAARGIDIPLLDNVINFNFPCKPKLFVHRVGRVARAGRTGTAFSLVSGDEVAYFIDLQLFLGNSVNLVPKKSNLSPDSEWHNVLGSVGQNIYDEYSDMVNGWHERSQELEDTKRVASNGYKMYLKSRTGASVESVKRARKMKAETIGRHPIMRRNDMENNVLGAEKADFLEQMKNFRPANTIFETGNTSRSAKERSMMVTKRSLHGNAIGRFRHKERDLDQDDAEPENNKRMRLEESSQDDLVSAFADRIVKPKAPRTVRVFENKRQKKQATKKDSDNYIGYEASDAVQEAGYSLMGNFDAAAKGAVLDIDGDDGASARAKKNQMRWDNKKKKYVRADATDKKKIKTESGVWIPASYKSNRYAKWKERSKLAQMQDEEAANGEDDSAEISKRRETHTGLDRRHPAMVKAASSGTKKGGLRDGEIKRPEQILKKRREDDKKRRNNARKPKKKGGKGRGKGKA